MFNCLGFLIIILVAYFIKKFIGQEPPEPVNPQYSYYHMVRFDD